MKKINRKKLLKSFFYLTGGILGLAGLYLLFSSLPLEVALVGLATFVFSGLWFIIYDILN